MDSKGKEETGYGTQLGEPSGSEMRSNNHASHCNASEGCSKVTPPTLIVHEGGQGRLSDDQISQSAIVNSNEVQSTPGQEDERSISEVQQESGGGIKHYFWYGLPKSAKAALVLCLIGTVLLIAYSITAVSLSSEDEEAHIATVIIILSIFTLFATADAIIYENTLQLVSSIILSLLMMARVLWFIVTRPALTNFLPLKVIWGALVIVVQIMYVVCALISCRQFGWRLYSRLGVDFRRPGAINVQRLAFIANLFNTLVKLDFVFLVVMCALGIDVAVEQRDTIDVPIFTISVCTFFLDLAISVFGLVVTSSRTWGKRILMFHLMMPLSYAGPIAVIVLYKTGSEDVANAGTSIIVAGCVFMVFRSALWWTLHLVAKSSHMILVHGRVTVKRESIRSWSRNGELPIKDQILYPLFEGSWIGKPTPSNKKKTRYFQLSHDGSTLRWGWNKFVRMYYAQGIAYSPEHMSITLNFLLDSDLTLLFSDETSFRAWKNGLEKLLVMLLSPEGTLKGLAAERTLRDRLDSSSDRGIMSRLGLRAKTFGRGSQSSNRLEAPTTPENSVTQLNALKTPSTEQLQRRQKMASYLFHTGGGEIKSPIAWFLGKRSIDTGLIEVDSMAMISVGTQTDANEMKRLMVTPHYKTDEEKTADIAAEYAAMLNMPGFGTPAPHESPVSNTNSSSIVRDTGTPLSPMAFSGERTKHSLDFLENSPSLRSGSTTNLAVSVDVIDFESLSIGKLLGSGSEGDVHAAWYLETPVAVKRFNKFEDASYEAGMYLAVGLHDNVVSLRALCQHDDDIYLIMEYCPRGNLDSMLHYSAPSQWDPVKLLPLIRAIARAMHHLHSRNILHRDLKPANVFIGHGQTMKVGDFGMSCIVSNDPPDGHDDQPTFIKNAKEILELVGSMQYTAPELVNPELQSSRDVLDWSKKLDVWSFGITVWEILERKRPFDGLDDMAIESLWLNSPYQARLPPIKIPEHGIPEKLKLIRGLSDMIEDCTRLDPDSRPTFHGILRRLKTLSKLSS